MSQIQELEALAEAFDQKAILLRQMAAELGIMASAVRTIKPAKKGRRKMSAAAKAKISKKLRAAWKVRKQIKEAK